jgi:hypothetical protein
MVEVCVAEEVEKRLALQALQRLVASAVHSSELDRLTDAELAEELSKMWFESTMLTPEADVLEQAMLRLRRASNGPLTPECYKKLREEFGGEFT